MPKAITRIYWTTLELRVLKEKYPLYGSRIPELSHHTQRAIIAKAGVEGVRYVPIKHRPKQRSSFLPWEEWEKDEIRDHYPYYGSNIPSLSHRSRMAKVAWDSR